MENKGMTNLNGIHIIGIKGEFVRRFGSCFDYELENGELLHYCEWNGEYYKVLARNSVTSERMEYWPVHVPLGDPADEQYKIVGFATDRTDRDEAEQALRLSGNCRYCGYRNKCQRRKRL